MKKVLVLVVLCVLFAGVMPASVEAKLLPKRTPFGRTLRNFIWASQEVEIGRINGLDAETGRVSISSAHYGGPTDFYLTENTNIRFDYPRGKGSFDELNIDDWVVINYYFREDVTYARNILILEKANFFLGYIRDVDLENRTIKVREPGCCINCGPINEYILYIPENAFITFDWDEDLHNFNELDEMKSKMIFGFYYDIDNIPYLIAPFIYVYGEASLC